MSLDLAAALAAREQRGVREPATTLLGWVVSSTSTTVTVRFADEQVLEVPKLRDYTSPVVDDVALLLKTGTRLYALGALNAAPTPEVEEDPEADATPPQPPSEHTQTFRPAGVSTYRSGWRGDTTDAYQGDWTGRGLNYGAAYYGTGPAGLTGTAVGGTVRIKRLRGGSFAAQAPTLRLLDHKGRPAGFPTFSASTAGPALGVDKAATVGLPTAWVQSLIDGTAGGIGVGVDTSSPYVRLAGPGNWSPAFELTLTWKE